MNIIASVSRVRSNNPILASTELPYKYEFSCDRRRRAPRGASPSSPGGAGRGRLDGRGACCWRSFSSTRPDCVSVS